MRDIAEAGEGEGGSGILFRSFGHQIRNPLEGNGLQADDEGAWCGN